jgi:uncharacterized cupredoxin-like copper-binding protein
MTRATTARKAASVIARVVLTSAMLSGVLALAGCGSTTTAASPDSSLTAAQTGAPNVSLTEWKLAVPATFSAGSKTFNITNTGSVRHELLAFKADLSASQYPVDADGKILEEDPTITKISDGDNLDPGKSQSRAIDLTNPGKYLFVCNLPSHFKQGMYVEVTVK